MAALHKAVQDQVQTLNPKPETLNPKPQTLDPEMGSLGDPSETLVEVVTHDQVQTLNRVQDRADAGHQP